MLATILFTLLTLVAAAYVALVLWVAWFILTRRANLPAAKLPDPILPKAKPLEDRLGQDLSARRRAWAVRMEVEEMCNRVAEGRAP